MTTNTENKISISAGNRKMGAIPSVSLPAITTCRKNAPCKRECYAAKLERIYPSVKNAYLRNLEILSRNPESFYLQLETEIALTSYFRFHVSGDFVNAEYFARCVEIVRRHPKTTCLAFTKQFEIVNTYIENGGTIPENFKIIFSGWGNWKCENPHGLPETNVIFKGKENEIPENWKICGGNCAECACRGVACWEAKSGDVIAFYQH